MSRGAIGSARRRLPTRDGRVKILMLESFDSAIALDMLSLRRPRGPLPLFLLTGILCSNACSSGRFSASDPEEVDAQYATPEASETLPSAGSNSGSVPAPVVETSDDGSSTTADGSPVPGVAATAGIPTVGTEMLSDATGQDRATTLEEKPREDREMPSDRTDMGRPGGTTAPVASGWGNVRFDGGGFVSGILPSPTQEGLAYARTAVGGVYRWDAGGDHWVPLMDWVGQDDVGLFEVESFALDPSDAAKLYVVAGTSYSSNGRTALLRSDDYGETFEVIDVSDQWRAHGNGMGRQSGEKLAVDPNDSSVLFCGTRAAGLFKSTDSGSTWTMVHPVGLQANAELAETNGISFVLFDPESAATATGATSTLFVGLSSTTEDNLYVSSDGGETLEPLLGGPQGLMPQRAALSGDELYLTYSDSLGPYGITSGAFYRYTVSTEEWTNLTPPTDDGAGLLGHGGPDFAHGFGGVSVDPMDPAHLLLTTLNFYGGQSRYADATEAWGDRIYETTDGGETWTTTFSWGDPSVARNANISPGDTAWIRGHGIQWAGAIAFDPFSSTKAWVVSGNGVFRSETLHTDKPVWKFESKGIEETVPLDLVSIVGGPLVTAIGDYDGAVYSDVTRPGPVHQPSIGTTHSLGYAPLVNTFLRTGHVKDYSTGTPVESDVLYYSSDGARTWTQLPTPAGTHGLVVLSADGEVLLHRPEDSTTVYRSEDQGATWGEVSGLDAQAQHARIVCDPVDAAVFYVLDDQGVLKRSTDRGVSFAAVGTVQDDERGLTQSSNGLIRTVPGRMGHLLAPLDQPLAEAKNGGYSDNGLAHSQDAGETWTRFESVKSAQAVGVGKAQEGADYETLFIWGVAGSPDNPVGIYYSTDKGLSWARMNDARHQYGGPGKGAFVQGDMNIFGRVYMSTAGRGLIYGNIDALQAP